jgi:hypothetical protein
MNIPTIYVTNVGVLFSVVFASFVIFWGVFKALKMVRH